LINEILLLIIGYLASFFMAVCIGANDASNPTDTAVGAGVISLKKALILFSIFTGIGALLQGWMVMKTLGKGIIAEIDLIGALTAVLSAGIWVLTATYLGIPISTSQSITGAVIGVGLYYVYTGFIKEINLRVVYNIILSWVSSPITCIFTAYLVYKITFHMVKNRVDYENIFKILLLFSLIFSAYSFGANDVGNATGVYLTVTEKVLGFPDVNTRLFLALIGSLGIAVGGFTLGWRVVETAAYKITKLELISSFSAELTNALIVWLYTTIPYMLFGWGLPISTTYASISSIIGVGLARGGWRSVNWRVVAVILSSWVLTLPATMGLAFTLNYVIRMFIMV